jgi:hypothetical protein
MGATPVAATCGDSKLEKTTKPITTGKPLARVFQSCERGTVCEVAPAF